MTSIEAAVQPAGSLARRIFIVGVPRSGTTLVQSFLTAHSKVTSFTESHFFSRFFKILTARRAVLVRDPSDRFEAFLLENGVHAEEAAEWVAPLRRAARSSALRPLRSRTVADLLIDGLDRLAVRRGFDVWVEKTPMHLRYTTWLDGLLAQRGAERPQFVHVVRRGPEAAASLFLASQKWERAYDLATCARRGCPGSAGGCREDARSLEARCPRDLEPSRVARATIFRTEARTARLRSDLGAKPARRSQAISAQRVSSPERPRREKETFPSGGRSGQWRTKAVPCRQARRSRSH